MSKRHIQPRRVDANQAAVVSVLRARGATVQSLASVGRGVPDLLVGWGGRNYLLEVKDGSLTPSRQALTADEAAWHEAWQGIVSVVRSPDEACRVVFEEKA